MLKADDLDVGMFVTVHSNDDFVNQHSCETPNGTAIATTVTKDRSYYGNPLQIKILELPYIVVADLEQYSFYLRKNSVRIIDIRRTKLMKISEEYVRAALGDKYDQAINY